MKIPFEYCADEYAAFRPGYPSALYDFLTARCALDGDSTIIDIGAGTGKGSVRLLERGFRVVAFDLSEKMLGAGRNKGNERRYMVCSSAEQIPLGDSSADLILCAQSFHWFASSGTLAEFARLVKPTGIPGALLEHAGDRADPPAGVRASDPEIQSGSRVRIPGQRLDADPRRGWPLSDHRAKEVRTLRINDHRTLEGPGAQYFLHPKYRRRTTRGIRGGVGRGAGTVRNLDRHSVLD